MMLADNMLSSLFSRKLHTLFFVRSDLTKQPIIILAGTGKEKLATAIKSTGTTF
jgi:hypothetical protein